MNKLTKLPASPLPILRFSSKPKIILCIKKNIRRAQGGHRSTSEETKKTTLALFASLRLNSLYPLTAPYEAQRSNKTIDVPQLPNGTLSGSRAWNP